MNNDTETKEPPKKRIDLKELPKVVDIEIIHVIYKEPKISYKGSQRIEHSEAVELILHTSTPMLASGDSPALYIGKEKWHDEGNFKTICEFEVVGENSYCYFLYDVNEIPKIGELLIHWGWPNTYRNQWINTNVPYKIKKKVNK